MGILEPGAGLSAAVTIPPDRSRILDWLRRTLEDLELGENAASVDERTGLLGEGVGLDSIDALRLMGAIESAFGLTLEDDEMTVEDLRTAGALVTFVETKLREHEVLP